jgi:hypothetical protein
MTASAYKLSFRAQQIADCDRPSSAISGRSLGKKNPARGQVPLNPIPTLSTAAVFR